jgi:hypothetical protein
MNNHGQFMEPVLKKFPRYQDSVLIAKACDAAILFGVLEYLNGNDSLKVPKDQLQALYEGKIAELNGVQRS